MRGVRGELKVVRVEENQRVETSRDLDQNVTKEPNDEKVCISSSNVSAPLVRWRLM